MNKDLLNYTMTYILYDYNVSVYIQHSLGYTEIVTFWSGIIKF